MIVNKIYTEGLEKKTVFLVGTKIKLSTISNFAEPITSKHNEWLEPKSVRVNNVAVLSKLPWNKTPYVQHKLQGKNLLDV